MKKYKLRKITDDDAIPPMFLNTGKPRAGRWVELECGHIRRAPVIDSKADALRIAFGARCRCYECGEAPKS